VPPRFFYDVVMDFDAYPRFITDMEEARTLRRDGEQAEVELVVRIIKPLRYTLRLRGEPPGRIVWDLVHGDLMKENSGEWRIEPGSGPDTTRARYRVRLALKGLIPAAVSARLTEVHLPAMLHQFKTRAETLFRGDDTR